MLYIIYKTTNLLNNKFYIGKHQCLTLEDGYLGSGRALKDAIAKYGKENFKREILFIFDTEADMNLKEKELVTLDLVNDPNCYNMMIGGEGGPNPVCNNQVIVKDKEQPDTVLSKMSGAP